MTLKRPESRYMVVGTYRVAIGSTIPEGKLYVLSAATDRVDVALLSRRGTAYVRETFPRLAAFRLERVSVRAPPVARLWARPKRDAEMLLEFCRRSVNPALRP